MWKMLALISPLHHTCRKLIGVLRYISVCPYVIFETNWVTWPRFLGAVYTNLDIQFKHIFFIWIGLPSSRNQWIHSPKPHLFETAHKNGLFGPVVNWNPIHPLCQLRRHFKYWAARRTTTFCLLGYCALNSSGIIFYLLSRSTKLQLIADVGKLLRLKRLPVNVFHWLSLYRPTRRMNRWKQAQKWRSP